MSVDVFTFGDPEKGSNDGKKKANKKLVMKVCAQAKNLAPIDSGNLKGSILWRTPDEEGGFEKGEKIKLKVKEGDAIVGTATEYAPYQEFGTKRMAAQPFLRPAVLIEVAGAAGLKEIKKQLIDTMKKELNNRKRKI